MMYNCYVLFFYLLIYLNFSLFVSLCYNYFDLFLILYLIMCFGFLGRILEIGWELFMVKVI